MSFVLLEFQGGEICQGGEMSSRGGDCPPLPPLVLHNVMSIFMFMGSNILRRDDPYSLQVITETISTVLPPVREGGRKRGWRE